MSTSDPIIRIDDIRKAGHCVAGARAWFGAHGLDFRTFLKDGLPASLLLATDDQFARDVVANAAARSAEHG